MSKRAVRTTAITAITPAWTGLLITSSAASPGDRSTTIRGRLGHRRQGWSVRGNDPGEMEQRQSGGSNLPLGVYNRLWKTPRAEDILDLERITPEERQRALEA